jgi:hypothetical protein
MLGDVDGGLAEIREGVSDKPGITPRMRAAGQRYLALACIAAGRAEEGLAALDGFAAFFYRPVISDLTRGELLLVRDPPDEREAEKLFRSVIAGARKQDVRLLELRGATHLARLLIRRGESAEAREMLADSYNWFTEGFETADLKDAKALLDELRS